MISEPAFKLTLQAVYQLGLRNKRHEALPAVLNEAITTFSGISKRVLDDFAALGTIKGDIRLFVRIPPDLQQGFEQMRSSLAKVAAGTCGTREVVVLCCLLEATRI